MLSRHIASHRSTMRLWSFTSLLTVIALSTGAAADDAPKRYAGLTLEEWDVRIKAFPFSSPEASRSVPGLISIVADGTAPWESRRQAALTLGRMGKPANSAVPTLARLAEDPHETEETRLWALTALARFGPQAAETSPVAAKILQNAGESHLLRLAATEVLGRIGSAHPATLDALMKRLAERDHDRADVSRESDLRVACTDAISLFGGTADGAVPVLIRQLQQHSGERVRQATLTTLAAIGPRAEVAAIPVAGVLVGDPVPLTRDRAAEALVQIRVEPLLIRLLDAPQPQTRERIAAALLRASLPVGAELSRAIRSCLENDPDLAVRAAALKTDWAWTRQADILAPVAVTLLQSDNRSARKAAYEILGLMGEEVRGVSADLEQVSRGADVQAATAARNLLNRLRR